MASIAIHTAAKMMVEPKSGWRISSTATIAMSTAETGEDRQRLVRLAQGQQPGHRHDEEGLQELRRLEQADAEVEPALGAVHLGAEPRHQRQRDNAEQRARSATAAADCSRGCIEMTIITGSDTPIHTIWR